VTVFERAVPMDIVQHNWITKDGRLGGPPMKLLVT
jgi:hypothetical protein